MRPRQRDPAFLNMAAIAGLGGILAIVFSIGFPIWIRLHGGPWNPAFSLFSAWGVAALGGAYACIRTYLISDDPQPPPRGGARLTLLKTTDARPLPKTNEPASREDAA